MKKSSIISLVTVASVILGSGLSVVSADELTVGSSDSSTVVTQPTTENVVVGGNETTITNPSVPLENTGSTVIGSAEVTLPSNSDKDKGIVVEPTSKSDTSTTDTSKSDTSTTDTNKVDEKMLPKADEVLNDGKSQVGTFSNETKQVVSDVSLEKPVETTTGYKIVGTVDSQVIVQNNDGSTNLVSAESVGGVVNADKTVSVKAKSGNMVTLPTTGEKSSNGSIIAGVLLVLGSLGVIFKKQLRELISKLIKK